MYQLWQLKAKQENGRTDWELLLESPEIMQVVLLAMRRNLNSDDSKITKTVSFTVQEKEATNGTTT